MSAVSSGQISAAAAENIRSWLTQPQFADVAPLIVEHVSAGKWRELEDAFWTTIPFGTAGRRGKMYPIGTNAINDRTIGESAQGLADYVRQSSRAVSDQQLRATSHAARSRTIPAIGRGILPNFAPRSWPPMGSRC